MDSENFVDGFTTNPTLMKTSGITDYLAFAKEVLSGVKEKSISFEVFSDELDDMYFQYPNLISERVDIKDPNFTNSPHIHETYEGRFLQLVKISDNPGTDEEEIEEVVEESQSFHYAIKEQFIQGGWQFMGIVLLCLILGLAVAIERIITLNLATTNTKLKIYKQS